jgi:hypothetical protein
LLQVTGVRIFAYKAVSLLDTQETNIALIKREQGLDLLTLLEKNERQLRS